MLCAADANIASKASKNPLFQAIPLLADIVKILCDARADPNAPNKPGVTPLSVAIRCNNANIVKILCDAGADLNAPNKNGSTPLAYASKLERGDIVKILRVNGAKHPHEK